MTKAEERGYETYPYFPTEVNLFGHKTITADGNSHDRAIYIEGYEQAEKDLSLTIEDIENIHTFLYAIKNNKHGVFTFTRLSDEQYKEVLQRFKAIKEEK